MIDAFLSRWLEAMIAVSWQFTLLFAVAALVALALGRRLTPAVRHALWSIVLIRLALPFGFEAPFGLAPRPEAWAERLGGRAELTGQPGPEAATAASSPSVSASDGDQDRPAGSRASATDLARGAEPSSSSSDIPGTTTRLPVAAFALWSGGVLSIGALQLARGRRARRFEGSAGEGRTMPAAVGEALVRAAAALGLRRPPHVRVVEGSVAAMRVVGVLAPRLLVPAAMTRDWSASELEPIFLHELAHIRRRDPVTRAFVNLAQILFFFHPLVWLAARRVRVERELACDDLAVLACSTGRRGYVEALLRVAREERRETGLESPALTLAGDDAGLRGRLSRMLAESYQPSSRTARGLVTCVVVALVVGAGASSYGERPPSVESTDAGESGRVRLRLSSHRVYVVDSLEEARGSQGLPWSGDFEWRGSREGSVPAAEQAMDSAELRGLLRSQGRLTYRLLVDAQGRVRDVRGTPEPADRAIATSVRAALESMAFRPAVRRADGRAVYVTSEVAVFLERTGASRLAVALALVGGDPAIEVVDLTGRVEPDPMGEPDFYERPPYLRIASRPAPPVIAGATDGLFSLALELSSDGRVASVSPLTFQSLTDPIPTSDPPPDPPEGIRRWIEAFELEMPAPLKLASSVSFGVIDVELRDGHAAVVTRAPMSVDALRASVAERYRLNEDRDLDLLPLPHPPERALLYRFGNPAQARHIPEGPSSLRVTIAENGQPRYRGASFGCGDLRSLLRSIGYDAKRIRGADDILDLELDADVVMRPFVDPSTLLDDLELALRERLGIELDLTRIDEPLDAIVLRGAVRSLPPDPDHEGKPTIHLYIDQRDPQPGGSSAYGPAGLALTRVLSSAVGMPVIDETIGAREVVVVRVHRSAMGTSQIQTVLRNLEADTGLETSIERRPSEIVMVTARN